MPADQNRQGERTTQLGVHARCISVTCTFARSLLQRPFRYQGSPTPSASPAAAAQLQLLLPSDYASLPAASVANKLAHTCTNHFKSQLLVCAFHPHAARVVTGNRTGELALWDLHNGFRFVKQLSAHQGAKVQALQWAQNEQLCLTGDSAGVVKCAPLRCAPASHTLHCYSIFLQLCRIDTGVGMQILEANV